MKILFIRSGNNGIDPITQNQGESIARRDCEVIYYNILGKGVFGYLKNVPGIRNSILKNKPDIVHAHYSLAGIISCLSLVKKPVICSLMGSDLINASPLSIQFIKIFSKFLWKATIVKNETMKYKLGSNAAYVIPNGVNLLLFKPYSKNDSRRVLNWNNNNFHILFASDPNRLEKNFQLAQMACLLVQKKIPNIKFHYLVNIPREQMHLYYNSADVVLLTSKYEGSPNVIKEAMACNCPIVATDVGDVRSIIAETSGCYITNFNVEEIAATLIKVLNSNIRTNGRENIQHLDSNIIADKIIAIYNKIVKY